MDPDDYYVAGLFDGEGWFQIDRARPKDTRRGITYQVHARICMRDRLLLDWIQSRYAGSLRQSARETEKHAAYYSWDVCGEGAAAFAHRVGSKLRIKREQAALAVEFQELKRTNKNGSMSDERFEALTGMYDRMRVLNKKGVSR